MRKKGRVTIADVARFAGLSPVTVSRALLSAPEKVSVKTRQSVEEAARRLGYIPDLSASTLASNNSGIVALVLSTLGASIFSGWVESFQKHLNDAGLHLLIGVSRYSLDTEQRLVQSFLGRRPDAIVLTSRYHTAETVRLLTATSIPALEVWDLSPSRWSHSVGMDNREAGRIAALHLIDRGYEKLVFATTSLGTRTSALRRRFSSRWTGFQRAAERAGVSARRYESGIDGVEIDAGSELMPEVMDAHPDMDALFVDNDMLAAGAVLHCANHGISVPDVVAICGLGGLPISRVLNPPVTTVGVPHGVLGEAASSMVVDLTSGRKPKHRRIALDIELCPGGTT